MPNLIESMVGRHLPEVPGGYRYKRLSGGISSEIYKIQPHNEGTEQKTLALTLIRDPSLWWKVGQEYALREVIQGDPEVLIPQLYDAGFDEPDGQKVAFILREFIAGNDLDTVLESDIVGETRDQDIKQLASDLGFRIALLHRHKTSMHGLVGRETEHPVDSWENHILNELDYESNKAAQIQPDKQIGTVRAGDIADMLPDLHHFVGSLQSSLCENNTPSLSHGDAHFHNFIAGQKEDDSWRISSMIDTEVAMGGDPEIDIAYMENWLHFSTYKEDFYRQSHSFADAYMQVRAISPHYQSRRFIYHGLRSLAYLRTVFEFDTQEFLRANPRNQVYVKKHFDIMRSLAVGNSLEDVNIKSLV